MLCYGAALVLMHFALDFQFWSVNDVAGCDEKLRSKPTLGEVIMLLCDVCGAKATHVLVDYNHTLIDENDERAADGLYFCASHAFIDGREACPICIRYSDMTESVYDDEDDVEVDLLRTYPPGTLDSEGCCSDHP